MNEAGSKRRPPPAVVLHERSGTWARQLRARLQDLPARWFETRSTSELTAATSACTSPVVLIESGTDPAPAIRDLARLVATASSPRILFLDPAGRPDVLRAAGEMGATLAPLDRPTPPEVAAIVRRWAALTALEIASEGWTRPLPADPSREPADWVEEVVAEAAEGALSCSIEGHSSTMTRRSDRDRDATP